MQTKKKKTLGQYTSRELTATILSLVTAGALILTVVAAPGLGVAIRYFQIENAREKRRLAKKIYDLKRSGYLEKGSGKYSVTEKGRHLISEHEVWNMKPPIQKRWNGEWHMVLFDIPGKKERARQALRARLIELEYKPYQNSVFLHKQNLRPLIEKFATFYGIKGSVRFVIAKKIL